MPARELPPDIKAILDAAAQAAEMDPQLLYDVAQRESGFNPNATSPAGAQGLMQLMPATGRELGVTDPYDPTQNANAGARYLRQLFDQFGGDLDKTLAGYNAGPGNVRKYGGIPPFPETQDYVRDIRAGYGGSGIFDQSALGGVMDEPIGDGIPSSGAPDYDFSPDPEVKQQLMRLIGQLAEPQQFQAPQYPMPNAPSQAGGIGAMLQQLAGMGGQGMQRLYDVNDQRSKVGMAQAGGEAEAHNMGLQDRRTRLNAAVAMLNDQMQQQQLMQYRQQDLQERQKYHEDTVKVRAKTQQDALKLAGSKGSDIAARQKEDDERARVARVDQQIDDYIAGMLGTAGQMKAEIEKNPRAAASAKEQVEYFIVGMGLNPEQAKRVRDTFERIFGFDISSAEQKLKPVQGPEAEKKPPRATPRKDTRMPDIPTMVP